MAVRVYFTRDDSSLDWIDLEQVALSGYPESLAWVPLPGRVASAWAWARSMLIDVVDTSPDAVARSRCEAICAQAQAWSDVHREAVGAVLLGQGWTLLPRGIVSAHFDKRGPREAFVLLALDASAGPDAFPPPVVLDMPRGVLPTEPCGRCDGCRPAQVQSEEPRYAVVEAPLSPPEACSATTPAAQAQEVADAPASAQDEPPLVPPQHAGWSPTAEELP